MNANHFRVRAGDRRAIGRYATSHTGQFTDKESAAAHLAKGVHRLEERQALLYAQGEYSLLIVLQGLDTAGKDGIVKHVLSGVNPLGTDVHAFKQPSSEELGHDFLWRVSRALPSRGRIGIFNRSYYEDVLVVRVHPQLLEAGHQPADRITQHVWKERYEDINAFERHLWRAGTIVLKFFLNISRREQKRRLLERLDDPAKNWKFSSGDLIERAKWDAYQDAYRDALAATSTSHAPWYCVPADHKWFARVVVADAIVDALDGLDLAMPKPSPDQKRELVRARKQLSASS
ncbi:MAG TPA: polyphosphate kinase 2 family protein [Vicinamibacterales bacterium]|nr:polyphosphate kinase 2 family protein [Vicinamibacterales bacterium]